MVIKKGKVRKVFVRQSSSRLVSHPRGVLNFGKQADGGFLLFVGDEVREVVVSPVIERAVSNGLLEVVDKPSKDKGSAKDDGSGSAEE